MAEKTRDKTKIQKKSGTHCPSQDSGGTTNTNKKAPAVRKLLWFSIVFVAVLWVTIGVNLETKTNTTIEFPLPPPNTLKTKNQLKPVDQAPLTKTIFIDPHISNMNKRSGENGLPEIDYSTTIGQETEITQNQFQKNINQFQPKTNKGKDTSGYNRPKIAIVIDDLGIDKKLTLEAINLEPPLTMSFIAYAKDIRTQAEKARKRGHEILLHVPMEPESNIIDPGPNVLLSGLPEDEILTLLRWNLEQLNNYIGINNHMGSRFTSNLESMRIVMKELKQRNLLFLDSLTTSKSTGHIAASEFKVPFITRNIFLDHKDELKTIKQQLKNLKKIARLQGYAIAIGHPRKNTIQALASWLADTKKQFDIVSARKIAGAR
ncbi:MAG: hypothetical protein CMF70_06470 [Magnetovibrio sp.]|nr:hypothetical protein [Magnetovibrio sp.]